MGALSHSYVGSTSVLPDKLSCHLIKIHQGSSQMGKTGQVSFPSSFVQNPSLRVVLMTKSCFPLRPLPPAAGTERANSAHDIQTHIGKHLHATFQSRSFFLPYLFSLHLLRATKQVTSAEVLYRAIPAE